MSSNPKSQDNLFQSGTVEEIEEYIASLKDSLKDHPEYESEIEKAEAVLKQRKETE